MNLKQEKEQLTLTTDWVERGVSVFTDMSSFFLLRQNTSIFRVASFRGGEHQLAKRWGTKKGKMDFKINLCDE